MQGSTNTVPQISILLTGAAGFIGARTAQVLLDQGFEVVGVDNLNDYYPPELKKHRLEELYKRPGFTFFQGDVTETEFINSLFTGSAFLGVINLAAMAGVRYSIEYPELYLKVNAQGTLNLLEAMRKHDCTKFVLASTSSLYAGGSMPFVEDKQIDRPISPYAASKRSAEIMSYTYHHLFNIDVTVLRYFTVYGPAGRPDMSPFKFIHSILNGLEFPLYGNGEQKRDFTFVDDIARGTAAALKKTGYEIINLGRGNNPISINGMIDLIEEFTGKRALPKKYPSHSADMEVTWADISKAKSVLGWQPEIDFEDGLKRTVDWHIANNYWLMTTTF